MESFSRHNSGPLLYKKVNSFVPKTVTNVTILNWAPTPGDLPKSSGK